MKKSAVMAVFLSLTLSVPSMATPQQRARIAGELQVTSDTLGAVVLGEKIQLMMRDGSYLKAKVLRASKTEIYVRIEKSTPAGRFPQSETSLQTAEIGAVYVRKSGSAAAAVALGVAGGILGIWGSGYAAQDARSAAAFMAAVVAGGAGGATGGAMLGRELARKTVTISVIPRSK